MRLPCERVVNEVLPAVRSLIAKDLQEKGYSQTEIADLLHITQPAVSQYLNKSRGKHIRQIESDDAAVEQLNELVAAVTDRRPEDELSQMLHDLCVTVIDTDCEKRLH
jgi:predicted transcriptional regulator